jgi:hypothetical protein
MRRFTAQQVIRHPWILYGPAADQRHNTRPPPPVPPPRGAVAGGIRELLENPQESSGTGPGLLKRQGSGGGKAGPPTGSGSGSGSTSAGAVAIPPPAAAGAVGAREVVMADGTIRHVRSSLNLERMHQAPFPPGNHGNHAPTMLSRTPPAVRRPPLRSSATMGAGQQVSSGATLPQGAGGKRGPQQQQRQPQKPVLVSYLQQTLHSARAGDLSSTSNLSMKYSGMASASKPPFNPHPSAAGSAVVSQASSGGDSSTGGGGGERKV